MTPTYFVTLLWLAFAVLVGAIVGYCIGEDAGGPKISRPDRERVLALVGPVVVDGECLGCGGREVVCSPPYVAHNPFCPELDRHEQIRRLLAL